MHNGADNTAFPSVDVSGSFYILIPSRFPTVDVFARIANGRSDEIAEIESITNPRLKERQRLLSGTRVVDTEDPLIQNWNHAPFTYFNPDGTRFYPPGRPALELAKDIQTALAISVRKREAFLTSTSQAPIGLEMRVLTRSVTGRFADCTDWDPEMDWGDRRSLGQAVSTAGLDGLLFRPAERPAGICASVLHGGALGRAVQGDHFKFIWDGDRVSTLYSFSSDKVFTPEDINGSEVVHAA
jgi:hypothetical protein